MAVPGLPGTVSFAISEESQRILMGKQGETLDNAPPPQNYEALIRLIHDEYDGMSKSYQRIAEFLTQNPNDVAIMPVNAIAESCGIHASSFVRFAQKLGYSGFKDLQVPFQRRLSTAAPGFEARVQALETDLARSEFRCKPVSSRPCRSRYRIPSITDGKRHQ